MYSDQEISNTTKKMIDTSNMFSQTGFSFKDSPYRNKRAELIGEAVKDINELRKGTNYKSITARLLSIKCNKNPFLKSDGELEFVLNECKKKRNYARLFWLLK